MSAEPVTNAVAGGSLSGPGVSSPTLSGAGRRFLSDILVELGFVEQSVAEQAVESARRPGMTPERVLLDSGTITPDQLARALAERYALDHIDLDEYPVDRAAAGVLRQTAARRYQAAPIGFTGEGALIVAIADPTDSLGLSDIAVMTKLAVRPAVAARGQIAKLLDELEFMDEPAVAGAHTIGGLIVPPDDTAAGPAVSLAPAAPAPVSAPAPVNDGRVAKLHDELEAAQDKLADAKQALREERERAAVALEEARQAERAKAEKSRAASVEEALRAERAKLERSRAEAIDEALRSERTKTEKVQAAALDEALAGRAGRAGTGTRRGRRGGAAGRTGQARAGPHRGARGGAAGRAGHARAGPRRGARGGPARRANQTPAGTRGGPRGGPAG